MFTISTFISPSNPASKATSYIGLVLIVRPTLSRTNGVIYPSEGCSYALMVRSSSFALRNIALCSRFVVFPLFILSTVPLAGPTPLHPAKYDTPLRF